MLNFIRNALSAGIPSNPKLSMDGNYKSYPFPECDSIYDVNSVIAGVPSFMKWTQNDHPKGVDSNRLLNPEYVIGSLRKYAANMIDEELKFFTPVFEQLLVTFDIHEIQCQDDGFFIYTSLSDKPVTLQVHVLNMTTTRGIAHYAS